MLSEGRGGVQDTYSYGRKTHYLRLSTSLLGSQTLPLLCKVSGLSWTPQTAKWPAYFGAGITWRLFYSHVWCLGWDDLKVGLSWECQPEWLLLSVPFMQLGLSRTMTVLYGGSGFHVRPFHQTKSEQHGLLWPSLKNHERHFPWATLSSHKPTQIQGEEPQTLLINGSRTKEFAAMF